MRNENKDRPEIFSRAQRREMPEEELRECSCVFAERRPSPRREFSEPEATSEIASPTPKRLHSRNDHPLTSR